MNQFIDDIFSIYTLINDNNNKKNTDIIKTNILSKQYLVYYLYRIITKFMPLISIALPSKDIKQLINLLLIPSEHDINKNYPLVGKMTNDEHTLNLVLKSILKIFTNLDKYIKTLPNKNSYDMLYKFLKQKNLQSILTDIQDLQSLIPGLSVHSSRFNYISDNKSSDI